MQRASAMHALASPASTTAVAIAACKGAAADATGKRDRATQAAAPRAAIAAPRAASMLRGRLPQLQAS